MTDSPAQLLAAVLRVVRPDAAFTVEEDCVIRHWDDSWRRDGCPDRHFAPNDISDLARVVAMLRGDQVGRFDDHLACAIKCRADPSAILTAPTNLILAALVAATGVDANGVKQ